MYSAIARRRKKALSSGIKSTTEQSLRRSHVNADVDFSGHLTAASLTIRHFLCTAHLEAVYALLQRVIRSFDCCVAPSRPVSPDGPAAVKNGEGDSGDQGGLCLEALLRALPLSTLTARCREMCDSERRSSQPADADPSQRNVPLGMSTDSVASSSGQILTLLGRLVNDACALLSAEESDNSMTVSNGILVSAYNTAICVTVLTAASTSATTSASVSVSASTSGSRTSISVPQSLLRRVSAINRYLRGVCSRGGKPKELPVKYCEVRKISAVINAQQALVAALETALSSSERSFASQSVPKSQHHSQSQPSGRQDVRPHLSHAELKALKDSALSMLSACDYLSHRSTASQMFSSADPLLAARPPTMTSTALRAVKCVCQALGLILSFIETVTKETFELAKLCFHTMMKAASAFSQILQCCESRLASSHHFSKTSALTPTTSALVARMDVAAMWSTILSFLVKLAKGLPPSLQSGAQTLVPQKVGADVDRANGHHDCASTCHP